MYKEVKYRVDVVLIGVDLLSKVIVEGRDRNSDVM